MEMVKKIDIDEDTFTASDLNSPLSEISSDTVLPKLSSIQGRTSGPTRRSTKGGWTEQEDDLLTEAVKLFNGKNWKKIAERFPGRSDVQCLHRWQKVLNPELVKGPWTKEEDDRIIEMVNQFGSKKWSYIAQSLPGRIGKQCRERWHNHLNPEIKKHAWTREEELTLIRAHQVYGNKWAEIAKFLPGRADNSIKNHWNCSVKKKLDSYLASGFTGDVLGINAYDFYNDDHKEETLKVKEANCDLEKLSSHDQGTDSDDCVDTSLGVSIFGVPNRRQKNLSSHSDSVKVENRCLSEDIHRQRKSLDEIQFECISPTALGLRSELRGEQDANCQTTSYDSHLLREIRHLCNNSARSSGDLSLSLSTVCDPLEVMRCRTNCQSPPTTNMGVTESPKRPRHCSSPLNECNSFFPSCGFASTNKVSHRRSNFSTTSPQPKDVSFCSPLESSPVCCSTPTSQMRSSSSVNGSSPEAILRTAALNFKNTPSIIRKRTRETYKHDFSGNDSNSTTCMSDMRSGSSNDSTHSCDRVLSEQDDFSLNVKWLSLSSPGLHAETETSMKTVEKRLEYAFDLEWNSSSQIKSSVPATETDTTMDCSMLLGIGVNCNSLN
ncbi:hypothetical protein ACHQM5_000757 [Ranunculus cassubicifolius]